MTPMRPLGSQVDYAVSAFLADVEEHGLADRILLIITGEMGRNPVLNVNGGRDHWESLTPLVCACGGLNMGQVSGQSDSRGGDAATERYTPQHLQGTIMNSLFDPGQLRLDTGVPCELAQIVSGSPHSCPRNRSSYSTQSVLRCVTNDWCIGRRIGCDRFSICGNRRQ